MALLLLASSWYLALVAVAGAAAWRAHRRRTSEIAAVDAELDYEERRERARAAHLARLRQEELAELRRAERRFVDNAHA